MSSWSPRKCRYPHVRSLPPVCFPCQKSSDKVRTRSTDSHREVASQCCSWKGRSCRLLSLEFCLPYDCNPHIQESPHPRAPKSPKSLKKDFQDLAARSVKKVSKKPPTTALVVFLTLFQVIWDFFGTFRHSGLGGPGTPFSGGISGSEGLATPVYGGSNRNANLDAQQSWKLGLPLLGVGLVRRNHSKFENKSWGSQKTFRCAILSFFVD